MFSFQQSSAIKRLSACSSGWGGGPEVAPETRLGNVLAGSAMPFVLVLYLSLEGGGYDAVVRSEVGIAVWWIVVVAALIGVLPLGRIVRPGWTALGMLIAFAAWTGLAAIWSESAERSIIELARVVTLLGIFALALATQGPGFLRRVAGSVAAAVAVVGVLSLASRLHPGWFPPTEVAESLPTEQARLSYPLTYWNAVATLIAMGGPLLLWTATAARSKVARALSVAVLPALALTVYYTLSRGGIAEAAVGAGVLLALHPRRLTLIPPVLLGGAGAAVLILFGSERSELADGLLTPTALDQGAAMFWIVLGVCLVVGLLAAAVQILEGRGSLSFPTVPRRLALRATLAVVAVLLVGAVATGVPGHLSDSWEQFKQPVTPGSDSGRFSSVSGSGRYQWWSAAVDAGESDPLKGIGPGTFEFWWARGDGGVPGFVRDAHSLYLESFGESGVPGGILITAFVFGIVGVGVARGLTWREEDERVAMVAAATAAAAAFAAAAAVDWSWEMTVLPVAFLLLGAGLLGQGATVPEELDEPPVAIPMWVPPRPILIGLAVLSLAIISLPMLGEQAVRRSQDEVNQGRLIDALQSARSAEGLLPFAATPRLQEALVLELGGALPEAERAAEEAADKEPTNWRNWLILSRIETELGDNGPATDAYRQAKLLNPRSALFGG